MMRARALFTLTLLLGLMLAVWASPAAARDTKADSTEVKGQPLNPHDTEKSEKGVPWGHPEKMERIPLFPDRQKADATEKNISDLDQKLMVARSLIAQRRYGPAADMLEVLLEENPDNYVIPNLLLNCYRSLNQSVRAESLLRRLLERNPDNFNYRLMLAEALAEMGEVDLARAQYDSTAALVTNQDTIRYQAILNSALHHDMEEQALGLISRLRSEFSDSSLFALQKGELLESEGDYDAAAREYFPILVNDTTREAAEAEKRLIAMLDFEGSSEEVESVLKEITESTSTNSARAYNILALYSLSQGDYDDAYRYTVKQDSLEGGKGGALYFFMRQCYDQKRYDQVLKVGDILISRYPNSPAMVDAMFSYADALAALQMYDSAVTIYANVGKVSPVESDVAEALYKTGELYANDLNDCESALVYYDSVVSDYPRSYSFLNAMMAIPRCKIRLGELDAARADYRRLQSQRMSEELKEEVDYHLALIEFYQKQFDSSQADFKKLMVDYPRGYYVNDALRLSLIMTEAQSSQEQLYDFSNAHYFSYRRMPDSARVRLERLVSADSAVLADISLLQLAELELDRGDTATAIQRLDQLVEKYPESYYVPYGLKTKADIMMTHIMTRDQAGALYRRILEEFPTYPFITDVRERLRKLEETVIG